MDKAGFWTFCGVLFGVVLAVFFLAPMLTSEPARDVETAVESQDVPASPPVQPDDATVSRTDISEADSAEADGAEKEIAEKDNAEVADTPVKTARTSDIAAVRTNRVMPMFDILRVEPDGSAVIAGSAEPSSRLDVMHGETVIATAQTNPSGEFVIVLDTPLAPGDYQLELKATDADNNTVLSDEVAAISVPASDPNELLAMVIRPGEPSRIIAQPQGAQAADPPQWPDAPSAADLLTRRAPEIAQPDQAGSSPSAVELPALPAGADALTGQAPAIAASSDETPQVETGLPPSGEEDAPQTPSVPDEPALDAPIELAARPPETSAEPRGDPAAVTPAVRIEAVEVEGDKLFIAGAGTANFTVRAYANDQAFGQARVAASGRFVIDGTLALSVGDHVIRADLIDPQTGQVVLRAEVPFNRPAGEQLAAVAPSQGEEAREQPLRQPEDPPAAPEEPVVIVEQGERPQRLEPEDSAPAPKTDQEPAGQQQADQDDTADARQAVMDQEPAAGRPSEPVRDQVADQLADQREELVRLDSDGQAARLAYPDEPPTIVQAPLRQANSASVIIRRGDTLWQISRRVYGHGVRYTTIYLANRNQIVDPDRIDPGQIFGVPDTPHDLKNAEEIHRKRLTGE